MSAPTGLRTSAVQYPVFPIPTPAVPQEHKEATWKLLLLTAICTAFVSLLLAALVVFSFGSDLQHVPGNRAPSCCAIEAEAMHRQLNLTLAPCLYFYDHVCSYFRDNVKVPAMRAFTTYFESDSHFSAMRRAEKAIYVFYQSCLAATAYAPSLGGSTAATYVDVLRADLAMRARSQQEIIAFLLTITFKYGIVAHPILSLYGRGIFNFVFFPGVKKMEDVVVIVMGQTKGREEDGFSNMYTHIRQDCLETITDKMSVNVTVEMMDDLERELDTDDLTYHLSNSSVLAEIAPPLTIDDWTSVVRNVTGADLPAQAFHSEKEALRRVFSVVLDLTRKITIISFFICKAVETFLVDHIEQSTHNTAVGSVFRFCDQLMGNYPILAATSALEWMMKNRDYDAVLQRTFSEIVQVLSRKVLTMFPHEDGRNASAYLKTLRLLLPSDIFPVDKPIPNLTNDYVKNHISLFTSGWSIYTYKPKLGILPGVTEAARLNKIRFFNKTVVIPLLDYGALNFNTSAARVLTMSSVGLKLADAIWDHLFSDHNWSAALTAMIANYKNCKRTVQDLMKSKKVFQWPLLSLDAALEAAKGSHWTDTFKTASQWQTSQSRLFFYYLVHHHYCPGREKQKPMRLNEVRYITSNSEDFNSAFHCSRPNTAKTCFLSAEQ